MSAPSALPVLVSCIFSLVAKRSSSHLSLSVSVCDTADAVITMDATPECRPRQTDDPFSQFRLGRAITAFLLLSLILGVTAQMGELGAEYISNALGAQ